MAYDLKYLFEVLATALCPFAMEDEELFIVKDNEKDQSIVITSMRLQDLAYCYELGTSIFSFNTSLHRTFDRFVLTSHYSSHPEYSLVAKRVDSGEIIGFILGDVISKEKICIGVLTWIAVHPDYQRNGIGSLLFNVVEQRMGEEKATEVVVDTPITNTQAIKFLEKMNFSSPIKQVYLSCPVSNGSKEHKCKESLTIGRMRIEDIYPVYQLGVSVFQPTKKSLNLYRYWGEEQVTGAYESDGDMAVVARIGDTVVGFALGSTLERVEKKFGYLIWLAVSPSAHGKGIGTSLYREYERLLKLDMPDIKTIMVDTQESNKTAINFFSRLGFVNTDTFVYLSKSFNHK